MHFLSTLMTVLGLSAIVLAAPAPAEANTQDPGWHGCGNGSACHADADCRSRPECIQMAGGPSHIDRIHCGQANHPVACWTELCPLTTSHNLFKITIISIYNAHTLLEPGL
ncbi:hypothetical protein P170DRAFT_468009 [Aspergillus steynii IBT 23096]|uniref:Uncharacterized protein n=1 Tax=Aspergillus steynii IBT 23096 TaxID=1392250 RepID=A0A2I2FUH0_9EURO|nr:uncharacterized protein P170DRAFT_468009 [Aspergillus steynii IBT 23096]PLB44295.1 hypothetical protein P170DRAFT_468009 [Aspergillus steynii IBT 23096]